MTTRRNFLAGSLAAGAASPLLTSDLSPLNALAAGAATSSGAATKKLVVLKMLGGWDYFQQIVPTYSAEYANARGALAISQTNSLQIATNVNERFAPALKPFQDLYKDGRLAVINNLGYPNPNLSHGESQSKWATGDPLVTRGSGVTGWLARYLHQLQNTPTPGGIDTGGTLTEALFGARVPAIGGSVSFDYQFDPATAGDDIVALAVMQASAILTEQQASRAVTREAGRRVRSSFEMFDRIKRLASGHRPRVNYPYEATITPAMRQVAGFIVGGFHAPIYHVTVGGWDDHSTLADTGAGHTGRFATRVGRVAGNVKAFLDDLKAYGKDQDVVVLIYSEFGRRLGVNGARGTDHGHGGVAYLAGVPVQAGVYGTFPDLTKATTPYTNWYPSFDNSSTDFRSLYATILEKYLGVRHERILGTRFPMLGAL